MVVVSVSVPETPFIVIVAAPVSAFLLNVSVMVLVEVVGFGLKETVPTDFPVALFSAVADSFTLPENPSTGLTVMVLVATAPGSAVSSDGLEESVKLGFCVESVKSTTVTPSPILATTLVAVTAPPFAGGCTAMLAKIPFGTVSVTFTCVPIG